MHRDKVRISLKILLVLVVGISLSGCGGTTSSKSQTPKTWLSDWDTQASVEGKNVFDGLESAKDSFEGEAYLRIPDNERAPLKTSEPAFWWSLYSGAKTLNEYVPLVSMAYSGDDWKFFEGLKLKFGEDVIELKLLQEPYRDAKEGYVLEILSFTLSKDEVDFLSQIFTLGSPEIRLSGSVDVITDVQFSKIELDNLKRVLIAYKYIVNEGIKP